MKAKKLVSTKQLTREDWLAIRKTGITGSRIAGILNISPWETPRSVYLDLIGERPEKQQTEPMYWGIVLEDLIAKEFAERTNTKVQRVNYILQHATYEFLLGNIDRLIYEETENGKTNKGILECKNVGAYSAEEWKNGAPEHYIAQLQFYLCLTGLDFGYLAALVGGQKFVYHRIERDEELIDRMIQASTDFWYTHVEPKVEPPVTERDTEILNEMYNTTDPDKIVNLTGERWHNIISETADIKQQLQSAEMKYELRCNQIKDLLKDGELITVDGERLASWKPNKNGKRMFRLFV